MINVATHRFDLWTAKFFCGWAVERGYLGVNPFKDVKPVGKVRAGKQQLRIDEARRFTETALSYFQERNKPLALGALLALMMGLRTSEVMNCVARDLDDGARYLWIDEGKTEMPAVTWTCPMCYAPSCYGSPKASAPMSCSSASAL